MSQRKYILVLWILNYRLAHVMQGFWLVVQREEYETEFFEYLAVKHVPR